MTPDTENLFIIILPATIAFFGAFLGTIIGGFITRTTQHRQ